jgi:hypothetical protein
MSIIVYPILYCGDGKYSLSNSIVLSYYKKVNLIFKSKFKLLVPTDVEGHGTNA